MCSKAQLSVIFNEIVNFATLNYGSKLDQVLLYGSYARGDYDDDSDIDIMILADITHEEANNLNNDLIMLTSNLGIENDIMISVFVIDSGTFNKWKDVLPFYKNVTREGVRLSA